MCNKSITTQLKVFGLCLLSSLVLGCSSEPEWLKPSGYAVDSPKNFNQRFEDYVTQTREKIEKVVAKVHFSEKAADSPFVGGYSAAQVAQMRGPFQIPEDGQLKCQDRDVHSAKGFLLIHGLTDSPYLLRNMANSLAQRYPCSLIRAVLLPGHGTVAGDTLTMNYQQWLKVTDYGVQSFASDSRIEDLYIVGFSTGTALAIKHLQQHQPGKIKGLVLLSAALEANTGLAWLTPYLKTVKSWININKDRDGARYSSFSTNAGAQFYLLTKDMLAKSNIVDIPVLMAVSADDATINAAAARQFFCNNLSHSRKLLLWYQGFSEQSTRLCKGVLDIPLTAIEQQKADQTTYRYANLAHTGLSVSPNDPHYGLEGVYRDCKAYEEEGDSQWKRCMQDDLGKRVFGEKNVANMPKILDQGMWRRGTFNKDYAALIEKIICFTDEQCTNQQLQTPLSIH